MDALQEVARKLTVKPGSVVVVSLIGQAYTPDYILKFSETIKAITDNVMVLFASGKDFSITVLEGDK